jgi:hypothetical protein
MQAIDRIHLGQKAVRVLALLALVAGVAGMATSYLYLASSDQLDVIAGAAGFVAGSVLIAAGLLSAAVLSRSPVAAATTVEPTAAAPALASPSVLARWLAHFRRNRENRPEPDWHAPMTLPAEVVRPLVKSLAEFQLGDGGGPASLIAWNAEQLRGSSAGARAVVDGWFAEEREHARLLGGAVARFGGRCIRGHWSFTAFCLVRKCFGVRFELTVLLLTEIVSTVYYRLLHRHAADPVLRSVCRLILRDETGHVAFHRDRLAHATNAGYGKWWEFRFRLLGLAAASVLWLSHAPALRALGSSRAEFFREVRLGLSRFVRRLRREALPD